MIFHITTRTEWEAARAAGAYRADTLATEGFIHASTREQVDWVAQAAFAGRTGLVLLAIDPDRLGAELRWEESEPGMAPFPHVYGPIEADAVIDVRDFNP